MSTNEAVQVKQESKIREDNNSWREYRETGKWELNETDKVIRRELNFSFPDVSQTQSVNTAKTIILEHTGRTRISKTECPGMDTWICFRYPTKEPWPEALLQLCLYALHGERKKDLDHKSGLGFKLQAPHPARACPLYQTHLIRASIFF